jgi:hypothetical protein
MPARRTRLASVMGESDPYIDDDDEPTYPAKPKVESGMRQKVRLDKNESTAVTVVVEVDPEPDTEPDTPTFSR